MVKYRADLRVTTLFNMVSGAYVDADIYLRQDERRISRLRRWLTEYHQNNTKYLACALCRGAVYLKGNSYHDSSQQLHFAHYQSTEYESCPLNDNNRPLSQNEQRAVKYNGVTESKRHFRLKNILGTIMGQDKDCDHIHVDKCYKNREKNERRRPDVQCIYKNQNLVFEIQLSTEFVTIISERENYYKEKNAFLLWLFDSTSTNHLNRSEKDIFYLNNSNMFCLDKKSIDSSLQQKKLNLLVYYEFPEIEGEKIVSKSAPPKRITIDDITFNKDTVSAYYFDHDKEFQVHRHTLIHSKLKKMIQADSQDDLAKYICEISDIKFIYSSKLFRFIMHMLSGKIGTDVTTGCNSKYIFNIQGMLNPFGNAELFAYFYTTAKHNKQELPNGKGRKTIPEKARDALKNLRDNKINSSYYPNPEYQEVFAFLFPEEHQRLLELISWAKIPWEGVDIDKFKALQLY